jgi:hypothetical protein
MKVNNPTVIALVLWFLFFVSHAFAVFKSPYPTKAEAPDQIITISDSSVGRIGGQINQTDSPRVIRNDKKNFLSWSRRHRQWYSVQSSEARLR